MDNQNQTTPQKQRLHPLIATAAGAVIVASLAATAAITGIFPKASSSNVQNGQTQAALIASQPAVDTAAAASAALAAQAQQQAAEQAAAQQKAAAVAQAEPKPAPRPAAPPHRRHTTAPQPPQYAQQPSAPAQTYCQSCGTVVAISQSRTPGQSSGIGAVGGAAAGGLLGNQFGHGNGRTAMTIIGALGGGLAGNQVEKQVRAETDYQVQVQMESGATRTFTYHNPPPFGQGQRVRIENGTLVGA
ncbi:MAG: glycine zipper 2TM domain-containing protein [Burkholderia sp.]|jgi:outer membrane lipoprotein SlyB|uniref:glycine zipper 2TM domain-containing protein n=1 Tax=Burkholderia sp. TaxID=36773 RepID=UPI00258FAA2F|nr:glycine zipper 2TM domain-containing protein [Burkholderia sp.]MCA3782524.1 glycine zipper 2TM domain-containing protein [Burkholderia sp.]MCA3783680.1 glycine zipper 2TM domain-containing protein [Burkholderia sp.]MCA3792687.1 glycine zipper 2TM domain-containing protein [Burkholderia sp.]MCA3802359.1 glycine zipper 2TM domain-containing protein [Burkholderia sp.]MCA3806751.1 glycine zipper 2TM domain-containing protein [Burkholderia sp.]